VNLAEARFTAPWRPTAQGMADELLRELEHYLHKPSTYRA
jgi:hypothetical protein